MLVTKQCNKFEALEPNSVLKIKSKVFYSLDLFYQMMRIRLSVIARFHIPESIKLVSN